MKKEIKKIEKLCGFYVSDWHFATMLLPYINLKLEKNVKIIPILENNIKENIQELVEKLNLKNQEKILSINWEETNTSKYSVIEEKLNKEINTNAKNIILINGNKEYIEKNNQNIEKWIQNINIEKIKIINFYEVTEFNSNIVKILNSHDKVFNTSGEKEINEVFEGYKKDA